MALTNVLGAHFGRSSEKIPRSSRDATEGIIHSMRYGAAAVKSRSTGAATRRTLLRTRWPGLMRFDSDQAKRVLCGPLRRSPEGYGTVRGNEPLTSLPIATALIAGLAHALEADHVAAVTTFVTRRPHPIRAMGFGIRWGLGHSAALLVAGGAIVALGLEMPEALVRWLEAGVGVMLFGLGVWAVRGAGGLAPPAGEDGQAHPGARPSRLTDATTFVGAAHGLAGTAGFLAIVPALLLASPWTAGGYLMLFGLGTVLAMGAYGLVAGLVFDRAGARVPQVARWMRLVTGLASAAIGVAWIAGALG